MTTINRELLAGSWRSWLDKGPHRVGPYWLQWVWTLLLCMVVAMGFTVISFAMSLNNAGGGWRGISVWARAYGASLMISLLIGVISHLWFEIGAHLFGARRLARFNMPQRLLYYSGIPFASAAIGIALIVRFTDSEGFSSWAANSKAVTASVLLSIGCTLVLYVYFDAKNRQIDAERRATEAQLRLLQGQIEPHFLFNTLANVQALIDIDAPKAKAMLEAFTDYLRGSLGSLRGASSTLGAECAMAESYLLLLQTRMDDRLAFSIDIDPALRAATLPPLLLQPLVENAIHHGLEPKLEGGSVRLSARREGDDLLLSVADDGLGLGAPAARRGAGVALANLRERLAARYGRRASLTLADNRPGTIATLRLPFEVDTP